MLLIYRVIQDQNVLYLQAKCMLHTVRLPWLFLQACTWFCQIYFHSSCCLLSSHMHILHTPPRARLLRSPSLQKGWVCCNSWKYISFFGKTAVNLMFNPRASVAVAPAHSILITQPGYSFYNWTAKASDRCGQGNLKARWHKEIKFLFCQNQALKKKKATQLTLIFSPRKKILIYRKVMGYGNILISFIPPMSLRPLHFLVCSLPQSQRDADSGVYYSQRFANHWTHLMYSLPNFSEQLTSQTLMRPIIGNRIRSEEHIRFATITAICLSGSIEVNSLLIITSDWSLHVALSKNEVPKSDSYWEEKKSLPCKGRTHFPLHFSVKA